jgi:hypothetical protein
METVKTYKLYPVRIAELVAEGNNKEKLIEYLNKNAEKFQKDYGILRTRVVPGNPQDALHVRIEFPICEIDERAQNHLTILTQDLEKEGFTANFVSPIKTAMVGAEDFPYEKIGNEIWKLHGQQKKAYRRFITLEKSE